MKISISKIRAFKSCRRLYQLRYIEKLVPEKLPQALELGISYHKLLEKIHKGDDSLEYEEYGKDLAMAFAYRKYIWPHLKVFSDIEKRIEYQLTEDCQLVGIVDGMTADGVIMEHKTTSLNLEEFEYMLQWDEQVLAYMLATGSRKMVFTVIKKPTIRQRKTETDEEFFNRCIHWYDEDPRERTRIITVERSDAEVKEFEEELKKVAVDIKTAEENDSLYKNTGYCKKWGRLCEYAPICLSYKSGEECFGFEKKED